MLLKLKPDMKFNLFKTIEIYVHKLPGTYKKLAVQCLNEVLSYVTSSVQSDSVRLPNRQLLVTINRYGQLKV